MLKINYLLAALLLLASCTQDELADNADALPEGQYPVEIASVSISGEGSVQPWGARSPQTRAAETADGNTTQWEEGDVFYVSDGNRIGTYRIEETEDGYAPKAVEPLYWQSKTEQKTLIAWFTQLQTENGGTLDLTNQKENGLAYVLRAKTTEAYGNGKINLNFSHQLAKLRVYVQGTGYEGNAETVQINGAYGACTVNEGTPIVSGDNTYTITMHPTTVDGAACFEANLLPGAFIGNNAFTVEIGGAPYYFSVDDLTLAAGKIHTVTLRLHEKGTIDIDLSTKEYTIDDDETYFFTGQGSHSIKVTGGNPEIYLEDAQISVSGGSAIDITGGSPTIHIKGKNNSTSSADNTGIAVSGGATVTIKGDSTADVLTAKGNNGGAGIGSPLNGTIGGNISIGNVTINATGGYESPYSGGAGIGSSCNGNCGDVTITDAVIVANGGNYSSGIGMGYGNTSQPSIGTITITNSDVTAKAGSYASAIGLPYSESAFGVSIDYKAGQIIITTDNLETFLSKLTAGGTANASFATYAQRIGVGSHSNSSSPSILNQDGSGPWEGVVINGASYAGGYE